MHNHDGSNGARARSARIRAGHDFEATQLDSMRRRTPASAARPERASLVARMSATLARVTGGRARDRGRPEIGLAEESETITAAP
jgi:hypothetical protein